MTLVGMFIWFRNFYCVLFINFKGFLGVRELGGGCFFLIFWNLVRDGGWGSYFFCRRNIVDGLGLSFSF